MAGELKERRYVVLKDSNCGASVVSTHANFEEAKATAVRYATTGQEPAYVAEVFERYDPQPPKPVEVVRYNTFKGTWGQKPLHAK